MNLESDRGDVKGIRRYGWTMAGIGVLLFAAGLAVRYMILLPFGAGLIAFGALAIVLGLVAILPSL